MTEQASNNRQNSESHQADLNGRVTLEFWEDEFEEKLEQWKHRIEQELQEKRIVVRVEKSIKKKKNMYKPAQLPKWLSKRMKGKEKREMQKTPKPTVWIRDEAEEQERTRRFQRDQEKEKLRQEKKGTLQPNSEGHTSDARKKKKKKKLRNKMHEALLQFATKIEVKHKKKGMKQAKKMPWANIIYTPMGGQNKRY